MFLLPFYPYNTRGYILHMLFYILLFFHLKMKSQQSFNIKFFPQFSDSFIEFLCNLLINYKSILLYNFFITHLFMDIWKI